MTIAGAPDVAEFHNTLAGVLADLGRHEEAAAEAREAVRLRPDYAEAHHNLSLVLSKSGRFNEAVEACRRVLELRPADPDAPHLLDAALTKAGRREEVVDNRRWAAERDLRNAESRRLLADALREAERAEEAEREAREALRLSPDCPDAHVTLGMALQDRNRADEALACFRRALDLRPDHAQAHVSEGMAAVQRGDWHNGWPAYEARRRAWDKKDLHERLPDKAWDGRSDLTGRTLLLYTEQGLGDTFQFARYCDVLKARRPGVRVVLRCQKPLAPLLRSSGVADEVAAEGEPPPAFDLHYPLLSLPAALGTTLDNVPADVPYLRPDPQLVEQWRRRLDDGTRRARVGLVWHTDPRHPFPRRIAPLATLEPLAKAAENAGVRLISLQKGDGSEQAAQVAGRFTVETPELAEASGAFTDTAAAMMSLDLVVSIDTAAAHLAGAMGVKTWLALPWSAEWRWMLGRDDSPWYPTMRLVRQEQPGDWAGVFRRMAGALGEEWCR